TDIAVLAFVNVVTSFTGLIISKPSAIKKQNYLFFIPERMTHFVYQQGGKTSLHAFPLGIIFNVGNSKLRHFNTSVAIIQLHQTEFLTFGVVESFDRGRGST